MKTKFTLTLTLFMALIVQLTFAQQRTISGTVSDENGLSLSGLADGSYFLVVDLYDNPFSTLNTGQPLPITLNMKPRIFPRDWRQRLFMMATPRTVVVGYKQLQHWTL